MPAVTPMVNQTAPTSNGIIPPPMGPLEAILQQLGLAPVPPPPAAAAQTVAPQPPLIQVPPPPPAVQPQAAAPVAPRAAAPAVAAAPAPTPMIRPGSDPAPANTNTPAPALSPEVIAMTKGLPPDIAAAVITESLRDERLAQALTDKQNQQSKIMEQIKDIPVPGYAGTDVALQAPPPVPDIEPIKAFQNWGVALAMLGSLMTRRPLTAALKSGAAAMSAYNEGRWRDYAAARANWKDNVDLAMKQNELEYRRYEAAREKYGDDLNKLTLAYQQIATEYGDKVALNDIQNGESDRFINLRLHLLDQQYRLAASYARYRYGVGGMTASQRLHDDRIQQARDELKANGVDYTDPKYLANMQGANSGFLTPEQQRLKQLYGTARLHKLSELYDLPGLDGSSGDQPDLGEPPVDGAIPYPTEKSADPEGHVIQDPDTGLYYVKHGQWALPSDESGNVLGDTGVAETGIPTLEGEDTGDTGETDQPIATGPSAGRWGGGRGPGARNLLPQP